MTSSILKKIETLPIPIGRILSAVPFGLRPGLGRRYSLLQSNAIRYLESPDFPKERYILENVKKIVRFAESQIPFYAQLYKKNGFCSDNLKTLDDMKRIPIVNKQILREAAPADVEHAEPGRFAANTGGTSGSPFCFYLSSRTNANEWAHMHLIWKKFGYTQRKIYLSIVGRSIKGIDKKFVCYDALRNRFLFNIYIDYEKSTQVLLKYAKRYPIEFLHGYPGSIYDYARFCETLPENELAVLRKNLKGVFLSSEYPVPIYRDKIEEVFQVPTVSWYGHSERIILAWERNEKFVYWPFQTYGFTEAIKQNDEKFHLIGTSYDNTAFPLIRYDTEDFVEPIQYDSNGVLQTFAINEARSVDFVQDKKGQNISLTALFFGRHHSIYQMASHIQIEQTEPGKAVMYIVMDNPSSDFQPSAYFSLDGIDIDFSYQIVDKPFRTKIGKIPLKINANLKK
ncbi:MAG: hypothetical protein Q4C95_00925 [Planctomycetia bacterium]|nr:hypothetical protein [Planctomycetia bacterium]